MNGMTSLLESVNVIRVENAAVAGSADVTGDAVDCLGAEGVMFVYGVGTLTAGQVTSLHAEQSDDDAATDAYSDIEGSSVGAMADGDSNKLLVLDVHKPGKRYIRPVLDRATQNAVLDFGIAIVYGKRTLPATQGTTVSKSDTVHYAAEGTA